MPKLMAYTQISLDGYFSDENRDMSWAHRGPADPEWTEFVTGNARSGGMLVMGRITYDLMKSYWPTPLARQNDAVVAEQMNAMPKLVFSKTIDTSAWANTQIIKGDIAAEMRKIKSGSGKDMSILGSGSIVSQLAEAGLIDEFLMVVLPVVLGSGHTPFESLKGRLDMRLANTRAFKNGNVVLTYEPVRLMKKMEK